MSDRTSPQIFGPIFEDINLYVGGEDRLYLAKKYWKLSHDFDFHSSDLGVDDALIDLGLARKVGHDVYYANRDGVLPSESEGT
jgi:hypothetical protein